MGTTKKAVNKVVNAKNETIKVEAKETKILLTEYRKKASERNTYHEQTKATEEASLFFHLKETQRRENEYLQRLQNEINALPNDLTKEQKTEKINEIKERYPITFALPYKYFREGKNVFELLGFMRPVNALQYGITDKVSHKKAVEIFNDYSENNHFGHVTIIESNTLRASKLSEVRKAYLSSTQTEKDLHKYLCDIDSLFNAPTKNKKTNSIEVPMYGASVVKLLFKNSLFTLISWEQKQRFDSETLTKALLSFCEGLTSNTKLTYTQIRYLLSKVDKKTQSKILALNIENKSGDSQANDLLDKIEETKQAKETQRKAVQTQRKANKVEIIPA